MYRIAICDDEAIFAKSLSSIVKKIMEELNLPYQLDLYLSCDQLWEVALDKPDAYQLLLLDIIMDGTDGMELARKLRNIGSSVTIAFITSTPDYSLQGYEVQALHYLLKPVDESTLKKIIQLDYPRKMRNEYLTVKEGTNIRRLNTNSICILETKGRKVAVYLAAETILVSAKLSELECRLPMDCFMRCLQSFILNMDQVAELRYGEAIMADGRSIPVSRAYLHKIQKAFLEKLGQP